MREEPAVRGSHVSKSKEDRDCLTLELVSRAARASTR